MHVKLQVEVVTPMFVGGANKALTAEEVEREGFRIPELRGQMRYWLRAIAGAVSSKLNDVQKLESRVLGA